jgi:hypothetical protein
MDDVDFPCVPTKVLTRIFPERCISSVIAHYERDRKRFGPEPPRVTGQVTFLTVFVLK